MDQKDTNYRCQESQRSQTCSTCKFATNCYVSRETPYLSSLGFLDDEPGNKDTMISNVLADYINLISPIWIARGTLDLGVERKSLILIKESLKYLQEYKYDKPKGMLIPWIDLDSILVDGQFVTPELREHINKVNIAVTEINTIDISIEEIPQIFGLAEKLKNLLHISANV